MATTISASQAKILYGIFAMHERMENGELRFRMLRKDGTGYVQTQATSDSGWQKSHVHENVRETYVVQSGWMALAELIDNEMVVRVFEADGIVTTRPHVTHNIYLSAEAVIHTVKHGAAQGPDRKPGKYGEALDILTGLLATESEIRAAAIGHSHGIKYSEEYRHFDNLIWQVPAWATAIFALSIQSVMQMVDHANVMEIHWRWLSMLILFLAGCVACFSLVLARFRIHQRAFKSFAPTPAWKSAATWTQSLVTLEVSALVGVSFVFLGMQIPYAVGLCLGVGSIAIVATEFTVRNAQVKEEK